MKAQKCPVCEGRGTVDANFYANEPRPGDTTASTCRACGGQGFILIPSPLRFTPPCHWGVPKTTAGEP